MSEHIIVVNASESFLRLKDALLSDVYRTPGVEAITKPFDPDTLVALIRQMLA